MKSYKKFILEKKIANYVMKLISLFTFLFFINNAEATS